MEKRKSVLSIIIGITMVSILVFGGGAGAEEPVVISIGAGGAAGTN